MRQQPVILFFNVNGSGMGHLNRCLAYAKQLKSQARCVFFSLASAMELIHEQGFEGDYFVSHYWSESSTYAWNSELAVRLNLLLSTLDPDVIVFDGTWPFQGLRTACLRHPEIPMIWSRRGLFKDDSRRPNLDNTRVDLIIVPGEFEEEGGSESQNIFPGIRQLSVPPVRLLNEDEVLSRDEARAALALPSDAHLVLFSLGPGNLKDVDNIGLGLLTEFRSQDFEVIWAKAPISVKDSELPDGVRTLSIYPLARYLRAFDVVVSAAGYNMCSEVLLAQVPTLFVPNTLLADDQWRRAKEISKFMPAVVSACETSDERKKAVTNILFMLRHKENTTARRVDKAHCRNGAVAAAATILTLARRARLRRRHTPSFADIQALTDALRVKLGSLAKQPSHDLLRASDLMTLKEPLDISHRLRPELYKSIAELDGTTPDVKRYDWQPCLKHDLENSLSSHKPETLLVWARDYDVDQVRTYCEIIQRRCQDEKGWVPVLVTDVSDFAWFSRLGWLVEYLPSIDAVQANYVDEKIRHLAWLYKEATVIPLAAASLNEADWKQLLDSRA